MVLAARKKDALWQLAEEIRGKGGRADGQRIAEFGSFDTWVNNAGLSMPVPARV